MIEVRDSDPHITGLVMPAKWVTEQDPAETSVGTETCETCDQGRVCLRHASGVNGDAVHVTGLGETE